MKKTCLVCQESFSVASNTCPRDGVTLTLIEDDNLLGKLFCDRYQIDEVIGGGGMGLVYKARHLLIQRTVAIKVLNSNSAAGRDAVMRFKAEAQAISVLAHPNILTVFDFGVAPQGQAYMVMDYLEGMALDVLLDKEGHLNPRLAVRIFQQVAAGLAHAHSKGVIHRDVKPSNIMLVSCEGRLDFVKIVDFGIAKMLNPPTAEAGNLTRTGEVFGSPMYMSPEQCRALKLDARTDIYSLGAMMYRALTGCTVFPHADALQLMFRQITEMPEPFSKAAEHLAIPEALEAVVFKCLAKEPADRYSSMAEVADVLVGLGGQMERSEALVDDCRASGSTRSVNLETEADSGDLDSFGTAASLRELLVNIPKEGEESGRLRGSEDSSTGRLVDVSVSEEAVAQLVDVSVAKEAISQAAGDAESPPIERKLLPNRVITERLLPAVRAKPYWAAAIVLPVVAIVAAFAVWLNWTKVAPTLSLSPPAPSESSGATGDGKTTSQAPARTAATSAAPARTAATSAAPARTAATSAAPARTAATSAAPARAAATSAAPARTAAPVSDSKAGADRGTRSPYATHNPVSRVSGTGNSGAADSPETGYRKGGAYSTAGRNGSTYSTAGGSGGAYASAAGEGSYAAARTSADAYSTTGGGAGNATAGGPHVSAGDSTSKTIARKATGIAKHHVNKAVKKSRTLKKLKNVLNNILDDL